ncbi:uncharacterized protein LOC129296001 [Prosopis cineraria]|uniref:uncharacterized protein LOC129296001 n=1 Tax=Prosopis cineraria TaxID=364024 RepID=UPI00240F288B|nr:uncharacterized protein LOC129296001 [Prosopis cineraria]
MESFDSIFFDPNNQTVLHPKYQSHLRSKLVLCAIDGWLLMFDTTKEHYLPFFYNPISGAKVMLPSQIQGQDQDYFLNTARVEASSAPHDNCHHDSIYIAGLMNDYCHIIFCKITSESWGVIEADEECNFLDITVIGDLLYVLIDQTELDIEIYNLNDVDNFDDENAPEAQKLLVLDPKPEINRMMTRAEHGDYLCFHNYEAICLGYDVVSEDLIIVVILYHLAYLFDHLVCHDIRGFRVLKLDRTIDDGIQLVEIQDLGDRLIFMDYRNCKVISTISLQESFRRNCIYFATFKNPEFYGSWKMYSGVFCLSDKSLHFYKPRKLNSYALIKYPAVCTWFMPSLF